MKLPFENWIEKQVEDVYGKVIFEESIQCYKASAYRGALLLSYLGLHIVIKNRIFKSPKPSSVRKQKWESLIKDLNNDEKWDSSTFDAIQSKAQDYLIFNLNDDVRNQYQYWKYRRHDVAHLKSNTIEYSHVESLWAFIQSNLSKFVVIGSDEEILNKIQNHFDPNKTPFGKDFKHVISILPTVVERGKELEFINKIFDILENSPTNSQKIEFINALFDVNVADFQSALLQCLKSNIRICLHLFRCYPKKVHYFTNESSLLRELWRIRIFEHSIIQDIIAFYGIYNQIEEGEKEEARKWVANKYINLNNYYLTNFEDIGIKLEFFEPIRIGMETIIIENINNSTYNYTNWWYQNNKKIIQWYFENYGYSEQMIQKINQSLLEEHYSWSMANDLRSTLQSNERIKEKFINTVGEDIIRRLGVEENHNVDVVENDVNESQHNDSPF